MKREFDDYFLGLDIGTDSVGWAITDKNYNIQKFNGKAMWGVRLFDEAKTAAERRTFRSARRRLDRRNQRIKLLEELLSVEINKIDPEFFLRLSESRYVKEDKKCTSYFSLFNDKEYNDVDYYKEFPTIYHLRKKLIETNQKMDIRLLYLAITHMLKHRGHFLFQNSNVDNVIEFEPIISELKLFLFDQFEIDFECKNIIKTEDILKDKTITKRDKERLLKELILLEPKIQKEIIKLLIGGTANLINLFNDENVVEEGKEKLCFNDKYDEKVLELEAMLDPEKMLLISKLKAIYDWSILADILKDNKYISYAKVGIYEKHKSDLDKLKKFVKENCTEKVYKEIFVEVVEKVDNYSAYIGKSIVSGKDKKIDKKVSQEAFLKYLKKKLENYFDKSEVGSSIKEEIENMTFLPKQVSKDNSVIPYQLNLLELKEILKNASKHYPFLNECDNRNISVMEKIILLLTFKIPYYVGPLNDAHKNIDGKDGNCWIVKRTDEKIRPWNFDEVVDKEKSAQAFITRMTNKCTYVIGADVLPKDSILYSKYMVLNELNNLKINDIKVSVEIKQKIYNELFMKYKKITGNRLKNFLLSNGIINKDDEISGFDKDFKASLSTYIDIKNIFGDKKYDEEIVETIIKWIVIFGDEKNMLKKQIKSQYLEVLDDEIIKKLSSLNYKGWGNFSYEFLKEVKGADKETGELQSIIMALYNTNNNLMQLLSNNFTYMESLEEINRDSANYDKIDYSIVDDLYVSPSVKRQIWQTLVIIKELNKVIQKKPEKIFIEMARGKEEKKRTVSRKDKLIDLYKSAKEDQKELLKILETKSDNDLRSDKLYLYFTQMGKCMYTGKTIDIENLMDNTIYDIDHIYPQSKTKDDSLDNRVLVYRVVNANKDNVYPLSKDIQSSQAAFWSMLSKRDLISQKKYERLVRTTPLSEQELADFISRQIVETRQTTKAVADILKRIYEETEIVYVKARNVSEFRQENKYIKVREINDFHHAKDAYLNIVVGNVYHTKFTSNPVNYIKNNKETPNYSLNKMYAFKVERNGSVAWEPGKKGTIEIVEKTLSKNNILFTRYSFKEKGGFFDQMLLKKENGQHPIKTSDHRLGDINKYGGYNKIKGSYFMVVESLDEKGNKFKSFEFVPVYLKDKLKNNKEEALKYCVNNLGLKEPKIIISEVKINSLISLDGFKMHISGRTSNQIIFKNANQLILDKEKEEYLKKIANYINRQTLSNKKIQIDEVYDKLNKEYNLVIYDEYIKKLKDTIYSLRLSAQAETLFKSRDDFKELTLEDQCKVLYEITHIFQCNSVSADLKLIKGPGSAGILVLSKKMNKKYKMKIINQSPTGLFESEIEI